MPTRERHIAGALALLLAAVTVALYARTAAFGYVFDDEHYIVANPGLALGFSAEGVRWAFTSFYHANWHPVAWLAHFADRALFGPAPGPAHLVNAGLHALCAALLFLVLRSLTGALLPSLLVAALFAFHPLRVESVAWVTERKDPLSTIFWLLACGAYLHYARKPGLGRYTLVAALVALGLMTKPSLVVLPFVFLLLDVWPLARRGPRPRPAQLLGLLLEKTPLLALAAAASVATLLAQEASGAIRGEERFALMIRLGNAAVSTVAYLGKTLVPRGLTAFYPHPGNAISSGRIAAALLLLVAITAVAALTTRRRPWLAVGWFWYLGALVPVIGIVQVGEQAMADRYTYAPSIGLLTALVWEIADRMRGRRHGRAMLAAAGTTVAAVLALLTHRQLDIWRDQRALFTHVLAVNGQDANAAYNLGLLDSAEGRTASAIEHYRRAVQNDPHHVRALVNLGLLLAARGRPGDAEAYYRQALRVAPESGEAHLNLGVLLAKRGQRAEGIEHLRAGLRARPDLPALHFFLAKALELEGRPEEAIASFRDALRLSPGDPELHFNLGVALERAGQRAEAVASYRETLRLLPSHERAPARLEFLRRAGF